MCVTNEGLLSNRNIGSLQMTGINGATPSLLAFVPPAPLYYDVGTSRSASRQYSAEQNVASGTMYLDSSDLELCQDGSTMQAVGLMFRGIQLTSAQASTLNNCHIWFDVDEVRCDEGTLAASAHTR